MIRGTAVILLLGLLVCTPAFAGQRAGLGKKWAEDYLSWHLDGEAHNMVPARGPIPDEKTARLIAEKLLSEKYGAESISKQKPFEVYLIEGHWIVAGTLSADKIGGTAMIVMTQKDGRVINISHGR